MQSSSGEMSVRGGEEEGEGSVVVGSEARGKRIEQKGKERRRRHEKEA